MEQFIYIVYEIDNYQTKSTFCIKGLSTDEAEAKEFFDKNKSDYEKSNDWFLILAKYQDGNFDIFSNIINELEIVEQSKF